MTEFFDFALTIALAFFACACIIGGLLLVTAAWWEFRDRWLT